MGEGVDDAGTDTEAGKRAGTRHKSDFADVAPGLVVSGELVVNKRQEFFGEVIGKSVLVGLVVEFENGSGSAGV